MKFLVSEKIVEEMERLFSEYNEFFMLSAWATSGFPLCEVLLTHQEKIKKAVVGTHFYQTGPDFIEKFMDHPGVRFIKDPKGVFHPKVYLFKSSKDKWVCIIGSPNFTHGGFYKNREIAVFISSEDTANEPIGNLEDEIEKCWSQAKKFNADDLADYKNLWEKNKPKVNALSLKYRRNKKGRQVVDLISLNWNEYFESVVGGEKHHTIDGRIRILEKARALFSKYGQFKKMPMEARKGLAGISNIPVDPDGDLYWGWFGSMIGAGHFKHTINTNNKFVSKALDEIPLNGKVSKANFMAFKRIFLKSYAYANPIAVATRLLCMKRPDYFVGINKANAAGICDAFDTKRAVRFEEYWDEVVAPIISSSWWNSSIPSESREKKLFKSRAAFLDSIYYEEI